MIPIDLAIQQLRNTKIQTVSDFFNSRQSCFNAVELDLAKTNSQMAKYADKHRQDIERNVGDLVYVPTEHLPLACQLYHKLAPRWVGPFYISSAISPIAFRIQFSSEYGWIHPIFHVSYL